LLIFSRLCSYLIFLGNFWVFHSFVDHYCEFLTYFAPANNIFEGKKELFYSEVSMQKREREKETAATEMSRHFLHDRKTERKTKRQKDWRTDKQTNRKVWSISINCQADVSLRHTSRLSIRRTEQLHGWQVRFPLDNRNFSTTDLSAVRGRKGKEKLCRPFKYSCLQTLRTNM
jgi:hypothetical protein